MERISFNQLPEGFYQKLQAIETYLHSSGLDLQLLELIRFRISQINDCDYCLDMHFKEAIAAGESQLRLYSLSAWRKAPYYTEKERLVLDFAEKLTLLSGHKTSEEDFQNLKAHFTQDQIAYLTLAITQINMWNRITEAFRFEPGKYQVQNEVQAHES